MRVGVGWGRLDGWLIWLYVYMCVTINKYAKQGFNHKLCFTQATNHVT